MRGVAPGPATGWRSLARRRVPLAALRAGFVAHSDKHELALARASVHLPVVTQSRSGRRSRLTLVVQILLEPQ